LQLGKTRARYLRLVTTRLRRRDAGHFGLALAEWEVLEGETNVAREADVRALDSIETGAWAAKNLVDGVRVSQGASGDEPRPAVMLRKGFRLPSGVKRATAFVTALGLYELRINGQRVGNHVLAPGWTDYHRRVQYQTFDVTDLLEEGENAIGAWLGDGWYSGRIGLAIIVPGGPIRGLYGRRPRLCLQIEIEHADGSECTLVTDASWKATLEGPIRRSCILDGEVYDARREMDGWDRPGFDDSRWESVEPVGGVDARRVAEAGVPMRITKVIRPVKVTEPKPNVFVFDLGQNMVGKSPSRSRTSSSSISARTWSAGAG
jgi:alpha-L-rhamnosidase